MYSAVYLRIQKWKNYWNRSTFAKVIVKIEVAPFLWPTVYSFELLPVCGSESFYIADLAFVFVVLLLLSQRIPRPSEICPICPAWQESVTEYVQTEVLDAFFWEWRTLLDISCSVFVLMQFKCPNSLPFLLRMLEFYAYTGFDHLIENWNFLRPSSLDCIFVSVSH